ncbi:MAG TPA: diguanylate cyclase, partial [Aliidongia sp.]|uniref:diguanylate cyclase n=1 Tax=Aliidongia sp. TaxID=1914230 RepID=UPI002DDD8727
VFGVLTGLILMVAAFEASGTRDIGQTLDRLSGDEVDGIQTLARIGGLAADIRVFDGQAILGETTSVETLALAEARTRAGRLQREIGHYATLLSSDPERRLYQTLLARADAFIAAQSDFERQFIDPEGSPSQWYRRRGRLVYDQARAAIDALIDENDRQAASDVGASRITRLHLSELADGMLGATLLLLLVAVIYVSTRIVEPLARLTATMRRLGQADWAVEIPAADRRDEIGEMARAVQAFRRQGMAGEQATASLREVNADLERLAMVDPLTGVANRRYFYQRGASEIDAAHRRHAPLTCLMIDIDFFKRVNDEHGHAAGDQVLKRVAEVITAGIRLYDLLGRLGGEEFAVLLPDADLATASLIAERLRMAVAASPALVEGVALPVTVSIGVSELAPEDAAIDPLLDRADRALYEAKHAGRDRVVGPGPRKSAASVVSGR